MTSRHNFTKCKDMFSAKNFTVYGFFGAIFILCSL